MRHRDKSERGMKGIRKKKGGRRKKITGEETEEKKRKREAYDATKQRRESFHFLAGGKFHLDEEESFLRFQRP